MQKVLMVFLVVFCLAVPSFAADSGVRFSGLNGQVEVAPGADDTAWSLAKMNTVLNVHDHVKTDEDSSAVLSFADMSTFVLKAESEIIISSPPDKDSKVTVERGSIWVNVKKMVKDGSMDIEMNQAVAGIKGTNITCSTDGTEDRIQVLRGMAAVLIKASQETVMVREGEELRVGPGGKKDQIKIDVEEIQKNWQEELSSIGDAIQMDEIPQLLKDMLNSQNEAFTSISDNYKVLLAAESVSLEDEQAFKKDAERFLGVILEDQVLLAATAQKVSREIIDAGGNQGKIQVLNGYTKMIADARSRMDGYGAELGKMMKAKFKTAATAASEEADSVIASVEAAWSEIDGIVAMLNGNPSGMSQSWFLESQDKCAVALQTLNDLGQRVGELLAEYPGDAKLLELQKKISDLQSQLGKVQKDIAIVEIDQTVLTEMQEFDDQLSDSILVLRTELDSYNTKVKNAEAPARLRASLSILNNFSKSRRVYLSSQRMYNSLMKKTSSAKFKTAEVEELEQTYDRITNTYQQLGIVAEQLEGRLKELESQLGTYLK